MSLSMLFGLEPEDVVFLGSYMCLGISKWAVELSTLIVITNSFATEQFLF
jgi:hypothetical protein